MSFARPYDALAFRPMGSAPLQPASVPVAQFIIRLPHANPSAGIHAPPPTVVVLPVEVPPCAEWVHKGGCPRDSCTLDHPQNRQAGMSFPHPTLPKPAHLTILLISLPPHPVHGELRVRRLPILPVQAPREHASLDPRPPARAARLPADGHGPRRAHFPRGRAQRRDALCPRAGGGGRAAHAVSTAAQPARLDVGVAAAAVLRVGRAVAAALDARLAAAGVSPAARVPAATTTQRPLGRARRRAAGTLQLWGLAAVGPWLPAAASRAHGGRPGRSGRREGRAEEGERAAPRPWAARLGADAPVVVADRLVHLLGVLAVSRLIVSFVATTMTIFVSYARSRDVRDVRKECDAPVFPTGKDGHAPPFITSYSPSALRLSRHSLQNRMMGSHSSRERGIPSCPGLRTASTSLKPFFSAASSAAEAPR